MMRSRGLLVRAASFKAMWWGGRCVHADAGMESLQAQRLEAARKKFEAAHVNWFPGHMVTATKMIADRIQAADVVFEVRDARAPLSSACAHLKPLLQGRKRLIILNKCDQVHTSDQKLWEDYFSARDEKVVFTDANGGLNISSILPPSLKSKGLANVRENRVFVAMIIGVPNTGKSTLINTLRRFGHKKKGKMRSNFAVTGNKPGITKSVSIVQFYADPAAFLIDTPGVMVPKSRQGTAGLRLALTGAIKDAVLDIVELANYLLYNLNRRKVLVYVQKFDMKGPTDDIEALLGAVGKRMGYRITRKSAELQEFESPTGAAGYFVDFEKSATTFVRMYRDGKLGKMVLDDVTEESDD